MRSAAVASILVIAACGGGEPAEPPAPQPAVEPEAAAPAGPEPLHAYVLDCGVIEISDLDSFSSAGDYAGETATFANTCWLIRHPDGDLVWDLGLPSQLVGAEPQENGVFTISMERRLTDQLIELGVAAAEIDYVAISHSHFDHTGQIDQISNATWLVHEDEYAAMFPELEDPEAAEDNAFGQFEGLEREVFSGERDVFGDGSVTILPFPGHTPGHTVLRLELPEAGPVLLTGDLFHRIESRELKRVPRFNWDEAVSLASMEAFETLAAEIGATVIIQHEPEHIAPLPKPPEALR